jgi:hypothetical protein
MLLNDQTTDFIKTFAADFGVQLTGTDHELEEYDEQPVSFNSETGRIGWHGHTARWTQFDIDGFSFEAQGARISGQVKLSFPIAGDRYDDYNEMADKVLAAIKAVCGPINYDNTVFEMNA